MNKRTSPLTLFWDPVHDSLTCLSFCGELLLPHHTKGVPLAFDLKETLISIDVEADGRIPGVYSMRSLGAAAFEIRKSVPCLIATFSENLLPLEGATEHPETMAWWKTQPEAWVACTKNAQPTQETMERFDAWLRSFRHPPFLAGYPAPWDFMFVYWYMARFALQEREGDTRFSLYSPFFLGIVEHERALWVVFELKEDRPRLHTPRVARPLTEQETKMLDRHLRRHASLAYFGKRREHFLSQANVYWEATCEMLEKKIQPELETLATAWGWKRESGHHWNLPRLLNDIWEAGKFGNDIEVTSRFVDLSALGLADCNDALLTFKRLA